MSLMSYRVRDSRFTVEGDRCGKVFFAEGDRRAVLEWEFCGMSVPAVAMVWNCRWTAPTERPMTWDELRAVAHDLAKAARAGILVAAEDGTNEIISP
jgi:hypothetical protein